MPRVIVIGAGISGLAAAWRLRKGGIEAVVLERSERPGGSIDAYWRLPPGRRVVLAGDSLAWHSAAFAGEWAADRVLELVAPD